MKQQQNAEKNENSEFLVVDDVFWLQNDQKKNEMVEKRHAKTKKPGNTIQTNENKIENFFCVDFNNRKFLATHDKPKKTVEK